MIRKSKHCGERGENTGLDRLQMTFMRFWTSNWSSAVDKTDKGQVAKIHCFERGRKRVKKIHCFHRGKGRVTKTHCFEGEERARDTDLLF